MAEETEIPETQHNTTSVSVLSGFFPRFLMQWLGPLGTVAIIGALLAGFISYSGILAFPASQPDPVGLARIVHGTFQRSVAYHAEDIEAPDDLNADWRVMAGAGHFARVCSSCHGAPGFGQNPVALSMRPRPQYLPAVVSQYSASQLFWIVRHGVKFSAMPAWPIDGRDDEVWSIVAFLRQLPTMSRRDYLQLAIGPAPSTQQERIAFGDATDRYAYAVRNDDEPPLDEFSYTVPAMGFQDSASLDNPLATCTGCHGETGAGRPGGVYPNLTLQRPGYLSSALTAFATGQRRSGIMQAVAAQLSPGQIGALARHFGESYQASPNTGTGSTSAEIRAGQRIVTAGVQDSDVGACSGCHGVEGASPLAFPRLKGQNAEYLRQQLLLFRAGGRGDTAGYDPMPAEAHGLTDAQINAVSAYYAAQAPNPGTAPTQQP